MGKIPSFVWIILVIVLGVGFLAFLNSKKDSGITATGQSLPVQVEVYVDYNCPHCAEFEHVVKDVKQTFGDKVNVQTKNLPFLAASSTDYAYAAEAARLQGKFDEFSYDMFAWMTYTKDPTNSVFTYSDEDKQFYAQTFDPSALAQRLGLDMDKYQSDVNGDEVKNIVKSQKEGIVKLIGTQSTPTVVIYGKPLSNNGDLKNKVQELINQIEKENK